MGLYLGIDGGGTGCRAAVADARRAGSSAAARRLRPTSGPIPTARSAASSPRRGRRWPRPAGGRPRRADRGARARRGQHARGGGAARRAAALRRGARSRRDALVALKGALGEADGITAALGTGSVFGVQRRRRGADHRRLGVPARRPGQRRADRAGAAARRRCSPTTGWPRRRRSCARCWPSPAGAEGIVAFGQRAAPADFARQVPRVLAAAAAGDPAARGDPGRGRGGGGARRSTGCRRTGRCRSASSAGSGRSSRARLARPLCRADPRAARQRARRGAGDGAGAGMTALFGPEAFAADGGGPLYLQLSRRIAAASRRARWRRGRACRPSARWRS